MRLNCYKRWLCSYVSLLPGGTDGALVAPFVLGRDGRLRLNPESVSLSVCFSLPTIYGNIHFVRQTPLIYNFAIACLPLIRP